MTIMPGQKVPSVPVRLVNASGIAAMPSDEVLGSGRVVVFTLPGAFTPTCHLNHLPGYLEAADDLKSAGVDRIICATANDHHVVKAWGEATGALGKIEFIADGLAALAKALGLDRDMSATGLGVRFSRNALIIEDGIVRVVNTETAPGEVTSSGAPAILEALKVLDQPQGGA